MSTIPPNLSRVPNLLASQIFLGNINRTGVGMLRAQEQLATGRAVNRPSDDIVRSATIGVLDDRVEWSNQLTRNFTHARASLNVLDNTFDEATTIAREAQAIASDQASATASASERAAQGVVIDQLIASLSNIANREGVAGYLLGGSTSTIPPISFLNGYARYTGQGSGIVTDLGHATGIAITAGQTGIAGTSSRVQSLVDLDPGLTRDTRLEDLRGGRRLGVTLGVIELSLNAGPRVQVDLSGADTVGDVMDRLTSAISAQEATQGVSVLSPAGIGLSDGSLSIGVNPGASVQFFEVSSGVTGRDLGLVGDPPATFTSGAGLGADLDPRVTMRTPLASLAGITLPLGQLRVTNAGRSAVVDLSSAQTVQDVRNAMESVNLGVRVEINAAGTGFNVVNEVSAGSALALSIGEVTVGGVPGTTATQLGIRTLAGTTRISEFNFGRGVQIVDGVANPPPGSGQQNVDLNVDMTITLGDAAGTRLSVDLRPQDMSDVNTLLARVNQQLQAGLASAGLPAGSIVAGLATDGNGLTLTQAPGLPNPIRVTPENNSPAAEQLGFLFGSYDAGTSTLRGEDRAKVRVDSLFSSLVDLRESMRGNSVAGITFAGGELDTLARTLTEERGLAGSFAQRVDGAEAREEDRTLLDESTRSQLRDLDYTEAITRFNLLQTQLEATLRSTSVSQQLTLLDFLR